MLLCGETPFGGNRNSSLLGVTDNILAGRFEFDLPDQDVWASVSKEAKDFIRTLLVTNPAQRPNAAQAKEHSWMARYQQQQVPQSPFVSPQILQSLVAFTELPITKRLMFEVISFTLMHDQTAHIQEVFEKLDQDGLGELSLENMRQLQRTEAMLPGDNASEQSNLLRNLSESELESIFERIKVGKAESRVHWHEFVAACLTTCHVSDGNIRIAFDRLDRNHDEFITYDAMVRMIARDADEDEDVLRRAWLDSVREYHCQQSQFTFDDFYRLVRSYV
jgi:calcium-dependent protein kinase